jgi:phosphoribosylformylglycinamidine (FGAM) synthase-like amidotransferase family enzyme
VHDALVEGSWDLIASAVRSDGPRDIETVQASLVDMNSAWASEAVGLTIELCGFSYGQILNCAKAIAAARRNQDEISDQAIDELRIADDVLGIARSLFDRCEPEAATFSPSLN